LSTKKERIEAVEKTRDIWKDLLDGVDPKKYYIQNKGYVGNCLIWWRLGGSGYTTNIREAQQYTEEEALRLCKVRPDEDFMWLVEIVEEAATLHVDSQNLDYRKRYGYKNE